VCETPAWGCGCSWLEGGGAVVLSRKGKRSLVAESAGGWVGREIFFPAFFHLAYPWFFLDCSTATQVTLRVQQERTHVFCSDKEAQKRLCSNDTATMDLERYFEMIHLYVGSVFRMWNVVLKWCICLLVVNLGIVIICVIIITFILCFVVFSMLCVCYFLFLFSHFVFVSYLFVVFIVKPKIWNPYFASRPGLEAKPLGVYPRGPRSSSCGPTKGTPPPGDTLCANWDWYSTSWRLGSHLWTYESPIHVHPQPPNSVPKSPTSDPPKHLTLKGVSCVLIFSSFFPPFDSRVFIENW